MAQLGVAGAGAVIGGVIGTFAGGQTLLGAQIGWALGGVAGALLFPENGPDQTGPRLNDLSVQTSGYGVPIPVVAGTAKLAGNVIWKRDLREQRTTRRQGKGGGPKITSFSYYGSWAVGLCEWLIPPTSPGVLRIWLDNKLVYDTTGTTEVVRIPGLTWRFYPGSETQLPDPLIEAEVGAAQAPAHRGLAYIVFDDVPVDTFGNRIPNVTVELADSVTASFPEVASVPPTTSIFPVSEPSLRLYSNAFPTNVAVDHARGRIYEGRTRNPQVANTAADEMIRVYDLVTMQTIAEHNFADVLQPLWGVTPPDELSNGVGLMHVGADGFLYVVGGTTATRMPVYKIDPDTMRAVDHFGPLGPNFGLTDDGTRVTIPLHLTSVQVPRLAADPITLLCVAGAYSGTYLINANFMEYVWGSAASVSPPPIASVVVGGLYNVKLAPGREDLLDGSDIWHLRGSYLTGSPRVILSRIRATSGALDIGGGAAMGVTRTDYADISLTALDASATVAVIQDAWWDDTDETLVITVAGGGTIGGGWSRFTTFKWQPGGSVLWSRVNHVAPGTNDARGQAARSLSGLWGMGGNFLTQTGDGTALVNAAGVTWRNSLAWLDEQTAVIGWPGTVLTPRELRKRFLSRSAANALTVGAVVSALCTRAGLQVSDVNVSALTDSLRGYILARPMSARDAITPLAAFAQFDAVEEDDVLRFRERAGAPVATIGYAELVRETADGGVLEELRAQDADLPREVTVRYADIDRGWEQGAQSWRRPISPTATMRSRGVAALDLPIPLTAAEAKAVARRFCVGAWRERTRLSFALPPSYLRLVPTDVITVGARDGASIRARILTVQLGANWVTRVEAVTEDAAIYALASAADGGSDYDRPQMPLPYNTRLVVPDLTLLDDGDDLGQSGLREYAFACAYSAGRFRGVTVIERGPGGPWEQLGVATIPAEWGGLIAAPTVPATPWTWDEVGVLRVRMTQGQPESATELEVLNGANRAALVSPDGRAEIVQWQTATQEADGTWTLSRLLRGRRGTEDQIATRAAGNLFLILDASRLSYAAAVGEATAPRQLKAVSIYQTPDTAPGPLVKAVRGRAERPYAPAYVLGSRDGSSNLTITWLRRTRLGGEWVDGTGTVPLAEGAEAYEVEILNGGTVVRTITGLTAPTASYTAAQQVTDFGSAQAAVVVRVYQISSIMGRGVAAEATV